MATDLASTFFGAAATFAGLVLSIRGSAEKLGGLLSSFKDLAFLFFILNLNTTTHDRMLRKLFVAFLAAILCFALVAQASTGADQIYDEAGLLRTRPTSRPHHLPPQSRRRCHHLPPRWPMSPPRRRHLPPQSPTPPLRLRPRLPPSRSFCAATTPDAVTARSSGTACGATATASASITTTIMKRNIAPTKLPATA